MSPTSSDTHDPTAKPTLPDGVVAFVKRDCPTCELVGPVLAALSKETPLTVYTQDDPTFPDGVERIDDTDLAASWHHEIEAVPTLLRVEGGQEVERA
ncbi:MAG: thioredoxin family protein, partial [Myxococcota bacterium]